MTQAVYATCLYIATKLGDLKDELVIIGGLVPSLLVPQSELPRDEQRHVGSLDVDLGLAIAVLDDERYHEISERLREAGFQCDVKADGKPTSQRWRVQEGKRNVTVDFLIPPTREGESGGTLRNLEEGFAAIITPGLELAFQDRQLVTLTGRTIRGEEATRELWVCGPGAFIVLKALALHLRGANKDAYDLFYLLQNFEGGIADVFARLEPLLNNSSTREALEFLRSDFASVESIGPRRVAEFMGDREDDAVRADAWGTVQAILRLCSTL
jgi:hypothetical protein